MYSSRCPNCGKEFIHDLIPNEASGRRHSADSLMRLCGCAKCEMCGKFGAKHVRDPYDYDILDEENYRWLCDECCQQRADDI